MWRCVQSGEKSPTNKLETSSPPAATTALDPVRFSPSEVSLTYIHTYLLT